MLPKNKTLINQVKNNKISNQYLLYGENLNEINYDAEALIYNLLVTNSNLKLKFDRDKLSDLLIIEPEKNSITIDKIRDIAKFVSTKPFESNNKVVLIRQADFMRTEASNALLKNLEEPKPFVYFILLTDNKNKLLKTIISRCQVINYLSERENQEFDYSQMLDILDKSMGQNLLTMLYSKEYLSDFQKETYVLFDFLMEFYSSFLKFVKTSDESSLNKDFVKLYKKYPKANERIIVETLDKIESVRGYFKVNANFELSMEELLLYIMEENYA
ncbi:MAG: DNA polymerase III subunit delta [Finegoldia magna]|uniref:DNA polymerase III subunit delta' n=1 Tax=Finegoldia magna TaxID=1260 RepID=UPI002913FE5A|nr:DNA polymerase III subunit delta [Finegoldia magna]MDU5526104.1 DNA polymerase III subunit delta [Finegoldia magna]